MKDLINYIAVAKIGDNFIYVKYIFILQFSYVSIYILFRVFFLRIYNIFI